MKSESPLVTISILNYNYRQYVGAAIQSALNQTYKNVEIIVIDDGSTDGSLDIIRPFGDDIALISHANQGIIKTRNEARSLANGIFQMQLDADDEIEENYVEKCLALALTSNADIVYTQAKIFGRVNFNTDFPEYNLDTLKLGNFIHASSLVRSTAFQNSSYDHYLDNKGYEDWDLFLDICMNGAKAILLDEPLLLYRKHEDARSRSDNFNGSLNEVLARIHIINKQKSKHPDAFKPLQQQIDILEKVSVTLNELTLENAELKKQLNNSREKNKSVTRIKNKLRRIAKK